MKKLLFLCIWAIIGFNSLKIFAQSQNMVDSLYYSAAVERDCEQLDLRTASVIRHENFAKCYLEIAKTDLLADANLEIFRNDAYFKTVNLHGETSFLLENLQLNANYTVQYNNSCDEKSILANFYTGRDEKPEGLTVSHQLFKAMEEFTKMDFLSLSEYLESESQLNYYEKLSFWQDIAFKDAPFGDNLPFGEYPQPNEVHGSGSECACMLLLTLPQFSPGIRIDIDPWVDIPTPDGFVPVYSGSIGAHTTPYSFQYWTDNPDKGGYLPILQGKGAARRQMNIARGRKMHTRLAELSVGDDGSQSPYYAQISIMWFCFGNGFHFADCGCKKDINYTAKYNTRLNSKMELPSCWLCGSKKGMSKAEDWSVLTLATQAGDVSVLAAGRGVVDSECEQTWNTDFFKQVVDIAADIAVVLVGAASGTGGVSWTTQIPNIADGINGLLETPIQNVTGCSQKEAVAALINKKGIINLVPNLGHYLTLYSMGNTHVQGTTSWEGSSLIRSEFNLAVAIPWGYTGNQSEDCCSHGLSSWVIADVPALTLTMGTSTVTITGDSPTNIEALKDDIETWLTLHLLGYNNTEYGALVKLSCGYGGKWDDHNQSMGDNFVPYQVFDMTGKSVASGNSLISDMRSRVFMQDLVLPKGIYFVHFVVNGKSESLKIINP